MSNCNCHTEITRDGSGQLARYLKALDPTYALIDDRNIEDLLVFAKRYAGQIRFYDIPESQMHDPDPTKTNWREFFRRDMAVIAASIGVVDTEQIKKDYTELREAIDADPQDHLFAELFSPIIGMAARIDAWYTIAIPENPLHADLDLAIASNLKPQLKKIIAYEKGFAQMDPGKTLKLDYGAIKNIELWGLNDQVAPDTSIYQGSTTEKKMLYASLYVDDIFNAFFGFMQQLVDISAGYLEYALKQYPSHQPHMALFIAFLQLFRLAQNQANGLTGKMLDFYYREVLHLTEKPSIPDRAYVVFELAKDITAFDIPAGTELKAGKDLSGKEQIYATETDFVLNQAKVKELKTIFIEKSEDAKSIDAIFARPIANSQDGFGLAFTDPSAKWPTFGRGVPQAKKIKNICQAIDRFNEISERKDQAQIGFALASPQLLMQGGRRLLSWTFEDFKKIFTQQNNALEIWLTAEKGWLKIDTPLNGVKPDTLDAILKDGDVKSWSLLDNFPEGYLISGTKLYIYLPIDSKPIIAFDAKAHPGYSYKTSFPIMQIMFGPALGLSTDDFQNLRFDKQVLSVRVGTMNPFEPNNDPGNQVRNLALFPIGEINLDGLKALTIKNDDGLVEIGKPFDPFTSTPFDGSSFYIGSDEIFNKPIRQLTINIEFMSKKDSLKGHIPGIFNEADIGLLRVSLRQKKAWTHITRPGDKEFTFVTLAENIFINDKLNLVPLDRRPLTYDKDITNETYKGFIQIENTPTQRFIEMDDDNFFERLQKLAQLIKIKDISVSYYSDLENFEPDIDQFFHVYPFGVVETYIPLPPAAAVAFRNLLPAPARLDMADMMSRRMNLIRTPALNLLREVPAFATMGDDNFLTLDKWKDYLLVDAKKKLLPQFAYTSPYSKYDAGAIDVESYKKLLNGVTKIDWNAEIIPKMIEASGLKEKTQGDINQYSGIIQEEGMLFIGIENLYPLQSISLLFQFAEGSAEDEDNDPPEIHWSYLTNNEWRPLKTENLVSDGTYGFQATGIVKIDVPADITSHNSIMPDNLVWFSASVKEKSNCIPMLVDVVAQAVVASFKDNGNAQSHFDMALPAGSISKLVVEVDEVSSVNQPFASFDGKHKEIGKEFYTRVSERLRHKARAITAWDYEHLVLDRFPSIYKVKCITHTDPNCLCPTPTVVPDDKHEDCTIGRHEILFDPSSAVLNAAAQSDLNRAADAMTKNPDCVIQLYGFNGKADEKIIRLNKSRIKNILQHFKDKGIPRERFQKGGDRSSKPDAIVIIGITSHDDNCCGPQIAPGHVLIIPIANLKNRNAVNPLQPKTSRLTLLAIQDYLSKRTSPFVHVYARNPVYEQVLVYFKVKFFPGTDKGYYLKKLNDEIVHFLTPWAFDENAEVKFGQKIYASSIINFIEERPYVDFIVDFLMFVCRDACCPPHHITVPDILINGKKDAVLDKYGDPIPDSPWFSNKENAIKVFGELCGCNDMEYLVEERSTFTGDVVAKPSTSRSILVSVPQHIIIPYSDPDFPSPCEKRAEQKLSLLPHKIKATTDEKTIAKPRAKRVSKKNSSKSGTGGHK